MDSIAIVGMAGRFPGAKNIDTLWENLINGIESKVVFSDAELVSAGVPEATVNRTNYVKSRCVIEDGEYFDASFFGITPREAELTDPQHRIFLECAWEALENAGYDPAAYDGSIGVFAGCGMNQYLLRNIAADRSLLDLVNERQLQVCSDKDFLSTRVSYKLNLKGPSLDIQTACSTSLVAIHIACQNLLDYQCDMALSGASHIQLPRTGGFLYSDGDMRSPDGTCRAFDADANGTVFGEGAAIVVLKRLDDALVDNDTIYAVIRGSAINNDGALKAGFSAPSVEGQAKVISAALSMAEVDADSISYIEAHGTGTALGDPIEVAALTRAFRETTSRTGFCAIGSIKPNIGHLDVASGVTGVIKAALSLYYKKIPPSINYKSPNPHFKLERSPFYVAAELTEWSSANVPRRAGVSSFGVGGTNAHVVLEEPPERPQYKELKRWEMLTLSAKTETALDKLTADLAMYLESHPEIPLSNVAATLNLGRRHFEHKRAIICKDNETAVAALSATDSINVLNGSSGTCPQSTVFLFTGQGAQYTSMAEGLYRNEKVFQDTVDYCAEKLKDSMGCDIRDLLFSNRNAVGGNRETAKIDQTEFAQPALFVVEYALYKLWEGYGVEPDMMIGHSIGEYVAACVSGVLSLDDALKVVAARGKLMQQQPGGCMLSVALAEDDLKPYMNEDIELSVINSQKSLVLSGSIDAIEKLEGRLQVDGVRSIRLHTSHAFHSRTMEPILNSFKDVFKDVKMAPPQIPFISNVTGEVITDGQATSPDYWARHLRYTVRFSDGVQNLLKDPDRLFIEIGPGNTLASLVKQIGVQFDFNECNKKNIDVIQSIRHPKQTVADEAFFLQALAKSWIVGKHIDFENLNVYAGCYRVPLPTYPFERKRYWVEPKWDEKQIERPVIESSEADQPGESVPGDVISVSVDKQSEPSDFQNNAAQLVAGIWQTLLGYDNIGGNDDFFELGGDSLGASQVLLRITDRFGVTLSLEDIFNHSTVNSIAKLIESRSAQQNAQVSAQTAIERLDRNQSLPLSRGQQRLWFLSRLEPESPAFNLSLAIRIEGHLDPAILRKSINALIYRHEALRTTFEEANGSARAVIHDVDEIELNFIDATMAEKGEASALAEIKTASMRPFDLEKGPLTRWHLIRSDSDRHLLVYQVHHIIFDGWSMGIVLKELGLLYEAYEKGKETPLPPLDIQYVDCAAWLEQWLQRRSMDQQIEYWNEQLGGQLPVLQLPLDRPRPRMPGYSGALSFFELPEELSEKIRSVSKACSVTYFMFFLAVFKVLLYRYSGQKDIIVGTPVAFRNRIEMEKVVGFFINMLALRSDMSDNPAFRKLLARTKTTAIDAFANQDLLFEQLVDILQPPRDINYHPVYQAMFAFHNFSFPQIELENIKLKNIMIDRGSSQLDLWLQLYEEDGLFKGVVEYSDELFDQNTIAQMITSYIALLEGIVADPDKGIENYPLFDKKQQSAILYDFNETQVTLPEVGCFHQLFERQVERSPGSPAVVFEDQTLSYAELDQRANQLAHYLVELGVGPDVLVGVYVERSLEMLVAVLGILKAGGAYVPLDPTYPSERIGYMIEDARMSVILTQDSLEDSLPGNDAVTVCLDEDWEEIALEDNKCPELAANGDNLAYVIFTSGSTGRPKGVQVPHRAVVNFLIGMSHEPGLSRDDVLLAVTTLSFDIHVLEIYLPLVVGAKAVIASREAASDGEQLLKLLEVTGVTVMQATPSTWRLLLAAGWQASPKLKILCGGEAFPRDLVKDLVPRVASVWNMYGPTETTVWSSCYRIEDPDAPVLIGRPIANTQIYILDHLMQPVPIGVAGELHIGGKGVTRGYLERPDLTKTQFVPDPFSPEPGALLYRTGDLARFRSDGNLEYISRIDTQVKVRGFRIELGEIESVLASHSTVSKCVAAVREDQPGDTRLVGYIVPVDKTEIDASGLRKYLRTKLPDYMVPQHFVILNDVPLTPAGKIDRKHLPAPAGNIATSAQSIAPRNETESLLAILWQEAMGIETVGVNESFFEIGGNSILALQLIHKINESFQVEMPLRKLFDAPTIMEFVPAIEDYLLTQIDSLTDEEAQRLLNPE